MKDLDPNLVSIWFDSRTGSQCLLDQAARFCNAAALLTSSSRNVIRKRSEKDTLKRIQLLIEILNVCMAGPGDRRILISFSVSEDHWSLENCLMLLHRHGRGC